MINYTIELITLTDLNHIGKLNIARSCVVSVKI